MTSRERVLKTIEFKKPDRAPIIHAYLPGVVLKHSKFLNEIFRKYPSDFGIGENNADPKKIDKRYLKGNIVKDEWGCVWQNVYEGIEGQVIEYPIKEYSDLKNYNPPNPLKNFDPQKYAKRIKESGHKKFILGSGHRLFERMHFLRGYENVLVDLMEGNPGIRELADIIHEYNIKLITAWLKLDIDGIATMDDWGTQTQLMIPPKIWREFFKPYYKEFFDIVHEAGKKVYFHSDGYILEIIPDLIELGLDVLNPQHEIIEDDKLIPLVKGKLCIATDLDRQHILPHGTPEEVKEHVKKVFSKFKTSKGGIIARGEIGPDVPLENIKAMYEAFMEFGEINFD